MDTYEKAKELVKKAEHTHDPAALWAFWKALEEMSAYKEAERVKRWAIRAECRFDVEVD